ncbi:LytR/AlgR family response regulator transcription factor [Sinomicrobium sp.]
MKIVIVEDEDLAARYLEQELVLLRGEDTDTITRISTVKEAIMWFREHTADLVFLDIHLADGNSMEILETTDNTIPIIFTTAYDDYAIQAFKHFTIDYLLKPFEPDELKKALDKYHFIRDKYTGADHLQAFRYHLQQEQQNYQKRFLVSSGHRLLPVEAEEVAFFYASGKHLFLHTRNEDSYLYNSTIRELVKKLDPSIFLRVNRNYIVHIEAVSRVIKHPNQRLELVLQQALPDSEKIFISKSETKHFREWLRQ